MFRSLLLTALLATSAATAVQAQSSGRPIAYVKPEGSGSAIYLTNAAGTSTVKLYASPAKTTIQTVDLSASGTSIAFVEYRNDRVLRVLNFNADGIAAGQPSTVATQCWPMTLDYHPTDHSKLIVVEHCGNHNLLTTVRTDRVERAVLQTGPWFDMPRWLRDGESYVYARAVSYSDQQLCRNDCEGSNLLWTGSVVGRLDVGRQNDWVLFDENSNYINKLDIATRTLSRRIINGFGGHYSPDDQSILYSTPTSQKGNSLMVVSGQGTTMIATKADYRWSDWRP